MRFVCFIVIVLLALSGCSSPKEEDVASYVYSFGKDREKQGLWVDFKDAYLEKSGYAVKAENLDSEALYKFIFIADHDSHEENVRIISMVMMASMHLNGISEPEIEKYFQAGLFNDEAIICYHSVMFCLNNDLIVDEKEQEKILANLICFAGSEPNVAIRDYILESIYELILRCNIQKRRLYEMSYNIGGEGLKSDMIKYIGLYEIKSRGALFFDYSSTKTLWLESY